MARVRPQGHRVIIGRCYLFNGRDFFPGTISSGRVSDSMGMERVMKAFAFVLLASAWAFAFPEFQQSKGPYEPPDREPNPEETLILELMNRFRADPSAEADLIAPAGK